MKRSIPLLVSLSALGLLSGCASHSSYVKSDTTLGRVVVYRNGVAYFERTAHVTGDSLNLSVPADKVDDFLKSLTVVDAQTGDPEPIAYPTTANGPAGTTLDMKIRLTGKASHDLRLSYVTEAPSWKPSYRVVLGTGGKLAVQAWAIVDNTSGEDWQNVKLGVGSSSALSFRFDLRSVREVQRETLQSDGLFAQAPPMGGASYGQQQAPQVFAQLDGLAVPTAAPPPPPAPPPQIVSELEDDRLADKTKEEHSKVTAGLSGGAQHGGGRKGAPAADAPPASSPKRESADESLRRLAGNLKSAAGQIVVEGYADAKDHDKKSASQERANHARDQLIQNGIPASKVVAVGHGEQPGHRAGIRVVEGPAPNTTPMAAAPPSGGSTDGDPIGTSHFESKSTMSVPRGTSAMVSILNSDTDGEVVYLFDPESARGNGNFPFKSVRLKNPTDSALESGPVTVFGDGRFIGEGLADPIPPHATAFVPFALDRQIIVDKKEAESDHIARILTVQRGVFTTELQHTRKQTLTLTNRTEDKVVVYVKRTVPAGYKLTTPEKGDERLGSAHLFRIEIEPHGKTDFTIEESTPMTRTTDVRDSSGLDLLAAYVSEGAMDAGLKNQMADILKMHRESANVGEQIDTMREQMSEYRQRMDELHAQVVTLKLVRTAGPLMQSLEKKLGEVSDKLSKSTIDLVALEEKQMLLRVRFQDALAELSLEKKDDAVAPKAVGQL